MYNVLFVCLGNICRSPLAEGVLRKKLEEEGLLGRVRVDSAGLHGFHEGEPPDRRSIKAALARGYSLEGQLARKITQEDFYQFDLIIGMDFANKVALERVKPENSRAEIHLLLDFAENPAQREVPDPYYGGAKDFEHIINLIESGTEGLVKILRNLPQSHHPAPPSVKDKPTRSA